MLSENLVTLAMVLSEDEVLRGWFISLDELSMARRIGELQTMAARMQAGGEDPEMVQTVNSLAHPEVFAAMLKTLRDLE